MKIALFDLDHTILDADTNILWIDYLVAQGLAHADTVKRQQHYMDLYNREALDMAEYMNFHISVFAHRSASAWKPVVQAFVQSQLLPRLAPDALDTLAQHRAAGDRVALVTATNSLLVGALGQEIGVHTISSEVEVIDDRITGRTVGLPAFRAHKIDRVEQWLALPIRSERIETSHFYSDSANDIALLQAVTHPVAVNADPKLRALAEQKGWPQRCWKAAAHPL